MFYKHLLVYLISYSHCSLDAALQKLPFDIAPHGLLTLTVPVTAIDALRHFETG